MPVGDDHISDEIDLDTEREVLQSCIESRDCLWAVMAEGLKKSDFSDTRHRMIWKILEDVGANGTGHASELMVVRRLRDDGNLPEVTATYVAELTNPLPCVIPDVTRGIVRQLKIAKQARNIRAIGVEVASTANPHDRIKTFQERGPDLMRNPQEIQPQKLNEIISNIDFSKASAPSVVTSGLSALDGILSLSPGSVNIIAAAPGVGKTTLAMQYALSVSSQHGPVLFISAEMTPEEMFKRMLAMETGYFSEIISNPRGQQVQRINDAQKLLSEIGKDLHLTTPGDLETRALTAKMSSMHKRYDLALVVVDYLQLLSLENVRGMNREQVVSEISHSLKRAAMALKIPLIVCSQLSRSHSHHNRAPELYDLRDSGAIEADADTVLMLQKENDNPGYTMAYLRKNRYGPIEKCRLRFGEGGKFFNISS